mmetsp:Transcript_34751/g.54250  ORF Transcript_34751/g.54250 Transcript_34751/m.54250 type:complete len:298 (+) Transcript_34751:1-894(+)
MPIKQRDVYDDYSDDSSPSTPVQERETRNKPNVEAAPAPAAPAPAPQQELLSLVSEPNPQSTNDLLSDILGSNSSPAPQPTSAAPGAGSGAAGSSGGAGSGNLLDLLGSSEPSPSPAPAPSSGGGLLDMLSGPSSTPAAYGSGNMPGSSPAASGGNMGSFGSTGSPAAAAANMGSGNSIPPIVAFEKSGVKIVFAFMKQPGAPNVTMINAVATNGTPFPLNNFTMQVAVPQYMKIQMGQTSGNVVPPNNSGQVAQQMKIANTMYGQQPPVMKLKIDFVVNGRPVGDLVTVTNFPQGV